MPKWTNFGGDMLAGTGGGDNLGGDTLARTGRGATTTRTGQCPGGARKTNDER